MKKFREFKESTVVDGVGELFSKKFDFKSSTQYLKLAESGMWNIFGQTAEKPLKKLIFVMVVQPWLHKYDNFQYENSTFYDFFTRFHAGPRYSVIYSWNRTTCCYKLTDSTGLLI